MTVRKSAVALAMVSALALTGVAACSSGDGGGLADEPVKEIEKQSVKAMRSAESMTMDAKITSEGQQMAMDVSMSKAGDCTGSMSMDGGNAEILRVDSKSYMKPDDKFWEISAGGSQEQAEAIAQLVDDRWVEMGTEDDFADFCDLDKLLEDMDEDDSGKSQKGETTTVAGTEAIAIEEKDGDENTTAYVATEGEPYVLKIVTKGGDEPGTATFSDFGKKIDVEAPVAEDTVDPEEFSG